MHFFTLTNYDKGVFTHPPLKKSTFFPIFPDFSRFFSIFAYGLNLTFAFFALTSYHNKMRKKCHQKNTKKMRKKVFNTLFYFSKMDKNKCPKFFLKKKFQKTKIFCFFFNIIRYSPFRRIYELSLYLSTSEELESGINVECVYKMTSVSIL